MFIFLRGKKGFTLVEIMIVVAIIGLLAAIAIPNFIKARDSARTNACKSNLKQIQGAVAMWAMETNKQGSDAVVKTGVTPDYLKTWPQCLGTDYGTPATVDTDPACPNSLTGHSL